MQVDLEQVPTGRVEPFRSQVCLIGGGIAGLVLASKLVKAGIDVHLLEAGGPTLEDRSQSVYDAGMAATLHTGTTEGRFRLFGGSSTRWGGQLLPYTEDVFTPPEGVPSDGWPIGSDEISGFYPEVEELLGVDREPFTAEVFRNFGRELPPGITASPEILLRASKWAPFSRRNLAQTLGATLLASPAATVFFHANVTELLLAPDGDRVAAILARDYSGRSFRFEAAQYVLAAGTIESSRLLLASRSVVSAGVGNGNDQVGRGFHDHLSYGAADVAGPARDRLLAWFAPLLARNGTTHTAKLEAAPALRQRLDLLNVMAHLTIAEPEDSGAAVVRGLLTSLQRGDLRGAFMKSLPQLPGATLEIARLAYDAKLRRRRFVSSAAKVTLRLDCEQRARPENRVRLHDVETDALGLPRAVIDWRVSPDETRTLRRFAGFLRGYVGELGLGSLVWRPELAAGDEAPLAEIRDTYHPMGGTLMGVDPGGSVVDADLRLHGMDNLSIASCSTFPAGGSSNPTFTLMALSLRLAERLQRAPGRDR